MNSAQDIFNNLKKMLEGKLSLTTINTWFGDAAAFDFKKDCLYISVPSSFTKQMIESRYTAISEEVLLDIFSYPIKLVVMTEEEANALRVAESDKDTSTEFTFERFVVGPSNRFAHAAAMAVAEKPAYIYNPLYIYGDSGLGKTHLLGAIAHVVKTNNPSTRVVYITGEEFTTDLISALRTQKQEDFRDKYRRADILLIDDIQFIAGKKQTEEEFFNTFNALYTSKIQIVVTADRPPKEMYTLENRLRSRFESGLLADIMPPDYETKMAIIKNKAELLNLSIPEPLCQYIASSIKANVRQIEGTVKKLLAKQNLLHQEISIDMVSEAIKDVLRDNPELKPTPNLIITEVAKYYDIPPDTIKSTSRKKETLIPRQVAMYIIREKAGLSLPEIGREFGKDHSTVMNSIRKIEEEMAKDEEFKSQVRDMCNNISENPH